jgi:hypothetical protein
MSATAGGVPGGGASAGRVSPSHRASGPLPRGRTCYRGHMRQTLYALVVAPMLLGSVRAPPAAVPSPAPVAAPATAATTAKAPTPSARPKRAGRPAIDPSLLKGCNIATFEFTLTETSHIEFGFDTLDDDRPLFCAIDTARIDVLPRLRLRPGLLPDATTRLTLVKAGRISTLLDGQRVAVRGGSFALRVEEHRLVATDFRPSPRRERSTAK